MNVENKFLTTKQVADILGISHRTLEGMRLRKTGPVFSKLGAGKGAKVRYRLSDVDCWLRTVSGVDHSRRLARGAEGALEDVEVVGLA